MWAFAVICEGIIALAMQTENFPWQAARPMLTARLTPVQGAAAQGTAKRSSGRSSGVEHNLAKVGVEGSNPFARSKILKQNQIIE